MKFEDIIDELDSTYFSVSKQLEESEAAMYRLLIKELKDLDLDKQGNIRTNAANIRKLAAIRSRMEGFIMNDDFQKAIETIVKSYITIARLQNQYFEQTIRDFKPSVITIELRKQAADLVKQQLSTSVVEEVRTVIGQKLLTAVTSGMSYADLQDDISRTLKGTGAEPGYIQKYSRTLATDSINTFSRQHMSLVASDLGYQWYRYQGSLIETSRPFCEAMVKKKWVHVSEFDDVIHGRFEEFRQMEDAKINPKTKMPNGLKEETTAQNFKELAGGWNCGHQLRPVAEEDVPANVRAITYQTDAYKRWKSLNNAE